MQGSTLDTMDILVDELRQRLRKMDDTLLLRCVQTELKGAAFRLLDAAFFLWTLHYTRPLRPSARPGEGRKIPQRTSHTKTARARPLMKGSHDQFRERKVSVWKLTFSSVLFS